MYAVEKVSSLISRGVNTFYSPFHPFGGVVDIIVVQQEDGSFKSSPWYVRFGKFQGVLKTREKVVSIAVNGVEASFHMYLDSNGEAYFLRDADPNADGGEFVVSPVSSGDEREVQTQDDQLRKSKSTSFDDSIIAANVGDGKIVTRTSSRRTTILDRVFGRRSGEANGHTVDRVSSLERAEIAAELLETKWSTNLSTRGSRAGNSNDEPTKNNATDAGNANQGDVLEMVLPDDGFDHDKVMGSICENVNSNFGSPLEGRNNLEDGNDHYLQSTSVMEVVEIITHENGGLANGITSATDQPGSGSLSNDLGADKSRNDSTDAEGELLDNLEDDLEREMCIKEVTSHNIFEIHTIETGITNDKSEVVSQFVMDGADPDFTDANSLAYGDIDVLNEKHEVSLVASTQDANQEKLVIISSSETVESSHAVSNTLADGVQLEECSRISSERGEEPTFEERPHCSYGASSNKEDMNNFGVQDRDVFVAEDSSSQIYQIDCPDKNVSVANDHNTYSAPDIACRHDLVFPDVVEDSSSQTYQTYCPDKEVSVDAVANEHDTDSARDIAYQHDLVFPDVFEDSSSQTYQTNCPAKEVFVYVVANDHGTDSAHDGANRHGLVFHNVLEGSSSQIHQTYCPDKEASVEFVANDQSTYSTHDIGSQHDLVFPGASTSVVEILSYVPENVHAEEVPKNTMENETSNGDIDVSYTQTSTEGDKTREFIVQLANFRNDVEPETLPEPSSLSEVKAQVIKLGDDANGSCSMSGVEIGLVSETFSRPREEAEAVVSFSESVEEIQFQFSDTESFLDRDTMNDLVAYEAAGTGEHDESDCDAEEQEVDDINHEQNLEKCCDSSKLEISTIPIPVNELHSRDNNLGAKSLPILRSHIHDLERPDSFQLSRSLDSNGENNRLNPVKSTNFGFPELEQGTSDSEESNGAPELANNTPTDHKHADDLKVDSFKPFVELSLCRHLLTEGMGEDAARKAFDSEKLTLEKFCAMSQSIIRNNKLVVRIAGRYFPWDAAAPIVLGMVSFREEQVFEPRGMIKVERVEPLAASGGGWRIWPFSFRRSRTMSIVQPVHESSEELSFSSPVKESSEESNEHRAKKTERKVRSLTPTSEELESLGLREGRNVVTFTFSTAMLGRQQVDARIYLWKWNTRIVISDVDGTITKSDVLGQFMPLVGVDWSQTGVAHLFSAIKENGYQLLFLSARAISQAHLTRRFLFNLKQDGKALPDGPVVISPDGLFPSLYREVIRRAPHEFKISCLEAIKSLFPSDSNPFYAGFGNRNTDELSYLKVGIPMGKIFIINPKGEVAVNRRVDTKSYSSLHALVNGMFPPMLMSSELEAYNSWNYWKMPLPAVDI